MIRPSTTAQSHWAVIQLNDLFGPSRDPIANITVDGSRCEVENCLVAGTSPQPITHPYRLRSQGIIATLRSQLLDVLEPFLSEVAAGTV